MEDTYPRAIFLIIATEFCERFSFCGLRTILSLYLRNELLVHENTATVVYHVFIMVCYLIPLVGAMLADSVLGRYKTILYFSMVYLVGNILMCLATIPPLSLPQMTSTIVGLMLIAAGTGGIKPCVAAFGGDQFVLPRQQDWLQKFFSMFYFTINLGGLVGMIVTPILRMAVTCYGSETCYAVGFGFPAALMLLGLVLFVMGKPWYRMKMPKENITLNFLKCTFVSVVEKVSFGMSRKDHWLDYSEGSCDHKFISDMKKMYSIMFLFIPLPIFWSLFDQQGSRWTFQASRTNGTIWKDVQVLPDQVQVVNPAFVLILIPLFERGLFPYFKLMQSPLHRMVLGGFMAGIAFISSGLLELQLEKTYPVLPSRGHAALNFINTLPCVVKIDMSYGTMNLLPEEMFLYQNISVYPNKIDFDATVYTDSDFCQRYELARKVAVPNS